MQKFTSPTKGELSLTEVVTDIASFMGEDSDASYRVVVGTDSQTRKARGKPEIDFITAVVIHRIGFGARYFWARDRQNREYVLRQKIYTETVKSLELAQIFVPMLRLTVPAREYDLEIHIDVGPIGPTRDMIKEVVGMVTGSGYKARTKPESYGASAVADRHT